MTNSSTEAKRFSIQSLKTIALTSYALLLMFMPLWLIYLSPSQLSPMIVLLFFTLPLLLPIKGLLKGNPFTYAWSNFILMIYFLHGSTTLWVVPEDRIFALIELLLTTSMFLSSTYYAKYKGQELGLSIRKKKTDT